MQELLGKIPESIKTTAMLKVFALLKVPMLYYASPSVVRINDAFVEVKIPLNRRTKNHLKTMYFGALCIGAEATVGILAVHHINKLKAKKMNFLFKDFQINFLKRAEGDVHFVCEEGLLLREKVREAMQSGERVNVLIKGKAIVPKVSRHQPIAEFTITFSMKQK